MLPADERRLSSARMVPVWLLWLGGKKQDALLDNSYIRLEHRKMPRAASAKRPHVTYQSQGRYVRAIASLCSYPLGLKSDGVATEGRMLISEMN